MLNNGFPRCVHLLLVMVLVYTYVRLILLFRENPIENFYVHNRGDGLKRMNTKNNFFLYYIQYTHTHIEQKERFVCIVYIIKCNAAGE